MGFRPLHDWVLIERSEPEEKTSGGIIIPDAARTKPTEGTVKAIGPGKFEEKKGAGKGKKEKKFVPTVLKPGQRVMFIDYMTKDIVLNGEEITIIQEGNILGVFESFGPVAVKKQYHVEVRKDHPPMVQAMKEMTDAKEKVKIRAEKKIPVKKRKEPASKVELAVTFRKAVKTGKPIKKVKAEVKTNTKKTAAKGKDNTMKKTVKKVAPKKAAPKKAVAKKTAKKAVVKKTVAKKAAPKKAVVKKAVAKKTVAKKAAPKKAAAKKVVKKTAAKKK